MFISSQKRLNNTSVSGSYLWVVTPPGGGFFESRAFVRTVKLRQLGHFMMGTIKVGHHFQTVSGAYGSDGLPDDAPQHVYDAAVPVPGELLEAWNNGGGGHNRAGGEAGSMSQWARDNIKQLRTAGQHLPTNYLDRVMSLYGAHGRLSLPTIEAEVERVFPYPSGEMSGDAFREALSQRNDGAAALRRKLVDGALVLAGLDRDWVAEHPGQALRRL